MGTSGAQAAADLGAWREAERAEGRQAPPGGAMEPRRGGRLAVGGQIEEDEEEARKNTASNGIY